MLFDFLKNAAGNYLDDDKISYFCHNSAKNLKWLTEQGFKIQDLEAPHSSQLPWRIHNSMGGEFTTAWVEKDRLWDGEEALSYL